MSDRFVVLSGCTGGGKSTLLDDPIDLTRPRISLRTIKDGDLGSI